ncbi:response regulator transcription factor [Chitinophaga sp. MM2321]|uniref:response regulator transcription factor n=1 Tax=Chitinophaga sp. MM2321 TaxID=3137178 RepID=UPI0032D5A791
MKKILIANEHFVIRTGLAQIISALPINTITEEAVTLDEVIIKLQKQHYDLLILDTDLPGGTHLNTVAATKLRQPTLSVLIFSDLSEQLYALNYLQVGADGYLDKKAKEEDIQLALISTLEGKKYISHVMKGEMQKKLVELTAESTNKVNSFSPREKEVMQLICKGLPVNEIAATLLIHATTVSTYKARIFEKMQVTNIIDLVKKMELFNLKN